MKLMNELGNKAVKFKSITEPFIDTSKESSHSSSWSTCSSPWHNWKGTLSWNVQRPDWSPPGSGSGYSEPQKDRKKNKQKAVLCEEYFREGKMTVTEICDRLEIYKTTYY